MPSTDHPISRRKLLKTAGAGTAGMLLSGHTAFAEPAEPPTTKPEDRTSAKSPILTGDAGTDLTLVAVTPRILRITIAAVGENIDNYYDDGSLVARTYPAALHTHRADQPSAPKEIAWGEHILLIETAPLRVTIHHPQRGIIQELTFDSEHNQVTFGYGGAPVYGLGPGSHPLDRRGTQDIMRNGAGDNLRLFGARNPIPWLFGKGWGLYFHLPTGRFDLTGDTGTWHPSDVARALDIFLVVGETPADLLRQYAELTGYPHLPARWTLGFQQSHRTLDNREQILSEAATFREKKLPCDALIYLGTGFCPSGWNTDNGSFAWNDRVFPDPKKMIAQLHDDHLKVVLHAVILADRLRGTVHDPCALAQFDEEQAGCYWDTHRKDFSMGVDGWWPDEGDPLDIPSRLVRNRMYWEGPQTDRPNQRPYALHRNGYAGMQRYASFLWSGDVYSTWETLKTHIPIAINTALTGIPYWGTDIGGFVPTKEFTAELYLRWFQFGAFCTLFRCHGRNWTLRLPWGWNTGDPGPMEISRYQGAAIPDASQLHNPQVEPICRKYLELRYRMLPYIYSVVRECTKTGLPVMRALWLEYPEDPEAAMRGDEYLWGPNVLVAPVLEQGATSRRVYLPKGDWFDFWTDERIEGGREITRPVDLETIPLYTRAGSILPLGPVKQYVEEKVDQPLTLTIYPGANASFLLYEDDGRSFNYRRGEWMGLEISWNDTSRVLGLRLAEGSKLLPPLRRKIELKLEHTVRTIEFDGRPVQVKL